MINAQLFEACMLICFGLSWPAAILKTWRTRRTEGKSLLFLAFILVGYLSGIAAKFIRANADRQAVELVTILYALNACFVAVEIALYLRFRPRPAIVDRSKPTLP